MSSERHKRASCKRCGRHKDEVGHISWGGNCPSCGNYALLENVAGLRARGGPAFRRWRRAVAASVGVTLLDD